MIDFKATCSKREKFEYMKNQKKNKYNVFMIVLLLCVLSLVFVYLFMIENANVLKNDSDGVVQIEYINTNIQRIVKLELENAPNDNSIKDIDHEIQNFTFSDGTLKYFSTDEEMSSIFIEFINNWHRFKDSIIEFRTNGDRQLLVTESEIHYEESLIILEKLAQHIDEVTHFLILLQRVIGVQIVLIILLLAVVLTKNISELKDNKELNKTLDIDTMTGLYNIAKCGEILDSPPELKNHSQRAIVVLDINYLRITNEELGREVGDKVILTFAAMIKQAVKVSPYETFFGRCGGDEFMVYFPVADQKDIELYIDELKFLCKKFNTDENNQFQLNFSIGYGITTHKTKLFTNRQLFDIADKYMFEHKIVMKELQRKAEETQNSKK